IPAHPGPTRSYTIVYRRLGLHNINSSQQSIIHGVRDMSKEILVRRNLLELRATEADREQLDWYIASLVGLGC
ncbi:MAG: hypothetical protein GSR78_04185, partial [Desulfurococcales archaeon]|nr:hypothetical protein [Desulfurococcales archaeon]